MSIRNARFTAAVIGPDAVVAKSLTPALQTAMNASVYTFTDLADAWAVLDQLRPDLIYAAQAPPAVDAPAFTRELRRSELAVRKAPVVMLAHDPTEALTRAARDAGVHEVLRDPFSLEELVRRTAAVLSHKRDWIEAISYVGPDRRHFNSGVYPGQRRRRADLESPEDARVGQALKIMKSAIEAIDSDPRQALRAMRAQIDALQDVALSKGDFVLVQTAKVLRGQLELSVHAGRFNGEGFAGDAQEVLGADAPVRRLAT